MFEHKTLQNLDEYFKNLKDRGGNINFFYRLNGFNENIRVFIKKYYIEARTYGVIIEGKIQNPTEKNLEYYKEIMGDDFQHSLEFISISLGKWLPRMNECQKTNVSMAIYDTLELMRREGKNENILKNAYIKFMCWLYYKFERIINLLGNDRIPKILYEGEISNYELKLFEILSKSGSDIVLLQYNGDENYLQLDKLSQFSNNYNCEILNEFPKDFNLSSIREEIEAEVRKERLYGIKPKYKNCTNFWIKGDAFEDIGKEIYLRGSDEDTFYNCFYRINGVEDKLTYQNELYRFYKQLINSKRKVVVVENSIDIPSPTEINSIIRKNYDNYEQLILNLSTNINFAENIELQRLMVKAFVDIILEEIKNSNLNLNKLTSTAIYILCWLKRFQTDLFSNWNMPMVSCFIYLGGCKNHNEALFLKFLSKLPVDVLILNPSLNTKCCLIDKMICEKDYENSLELDVFPKDNSEIRVATAAYHAERELDSIIYEDSGLYRNQQYNKSKAVVLKTMYEEIKILWDEELKYRPNFCVIDDVVNIPVIFAKVCGIKDSNISQYWSEIKSLFVQDAFIIKSLPYLNSNTQNLLKPHVTSFFKNGRLLRNTIKEHKNYRYKFLRDEKQEMIFDKLQLLIDSGVIKGTFENGTEYTIISTVLNLNLDIIRLIQKFDFTKKNPKIICIDTTEAIASLEDSIMIAFLSLIGFDVLIFVPTGYQNVEVHYNTNIMEEHQIGEYVYDLILPDFNFVGSHQSRLSWHQKIFKRG